MGKDFNPDVTYYDVHPVETIEMMRRIYGDAETAIFCKLSAFKYRMRVGLKSEDIERDLIKEKDYLSKYKQLNENKIKDLKWTTIS